MQPVLLGGLFIGVLSALPIVQMCNCCCLWLAGGGVLAAYLQQQNQPGPLTVMNGARVGLLAGVAGAVVWLVLTPAFDVVLTPFREQMISYVLRNASDMPPEVRAWLESVEREGPGGYTFAFLLMLVFGSLVAALGGAIGASYFRTDVPPALGGTAPPPPLP